MYSLTAHIRRRTNYPWIWNWYTISSWQAPSATYIFKRVPFFKFSSKFQPVNHSKLEMLDEMAFDNDSAEAESTVVGDVPSGEEIKVSSREPRQKRSKLISQQMWDSDWEDWDTTTKLKTDPR